MNVLITGSAGFVGTHLRAALRSQGVSVFGFGAEECVPGAGEGYCQGNLLSAIQLREAIEEAQPDWVFHLAAVTGHGGAEAIRTAIDVNVTGTGRLMAALSERGKPVRVVHMGSSAQYGAVPEQFDPVAEIAPQFPMGVYGWSKTASEAVAMAHAGRGGIDVVGARPFNQTGPGEPPHLVVAAFAEQVAEIENGAEPVLHVGNLQAVRDFTDVRDTVRGLVDLARSGMSGRIYNLCSGRGMRVQDVLAMLLDKSTSTIEVRADPTRSRPADLAKQVGTAERARREVGWTPAIDLSTSLSDVLEDWRRRVRVKESRS
ncbi:GDP-mannose 4,6-dehydratase [bacterium]|nr:GDP-mannose 4,6-dehydratase [bacterium]